MHKTIFTSGLCLLFGLAGCAHASGGTREEAASAGTLEPDRSYTGSCPMDIPETQVSATDTNDGEALTFTTTSGQVSDLRGRVRAMADTLNRNAAAQAGATSTDPGASAADISTGGTGSGGVGQTPGARRGKLHASVEDVEDGARVLLTPGDPADTNVLRRAARMHAEQLQENGCAMMHEGG